LKLESGKIASQRNRGEIRRKNEFFFDFKTLFFTHTHALFHKHTHTLSLSLSHTHTHAHTYTYTHTDTHARPFSRTHTLSFYLSHTHKSTHIQHTETYKSYIHTHTRTHTHTHAHTRKHTLNSNSFFQTIPHTQIHTHTHTHTCKDIHTRVSVSLVRWDNFCVEEVKRILLQVHPPQDVYIRPKEGRRAGWAKYEVFVFLLRFVVTCNICMRLESLPWL